MRKGQRVSKKDLNEIISKSVAGIVAEQLGKALEKQGLGSARHLDLGRTPGSVIRSRKFETTPEQKGIAAARYIRAFAAGKGHLDQAKYFVQKVYDDDLGDEIVKAMTAGELGAGGGLIPPEYASEIIELLRSRTVVRRAGARMLPMTSGSITLRKQTSASSASYVGESEDIGVTQPGEGLLTLTSKKLAAIVPLSNDLIKFSSSPTADSFVRDDLIQVIAIREDRAFMRDDGLDHTPRGLRSWAVAANILSSNGTTATNIEDDFKDLINALENADVNFVNPVWIMHPTRKNHLRNLRDANGNLIYPEIRGSNPMLYGYPVFVTTSIPANLGVGGNESEVYLVEMNEAIIAEVSNLEIEVDSSAAYVENGTLVSAFSRDETAIRAIERHDFGMRHGEAVAYISDVTWGS